jgi:hypothetical protein
MKRSWPGVIRRGFAYDGTRRAIADLEWYFDEPTRVQLGKLASQVDKWILQAPGAPPYAVILEDRPCSGIHVFKRGNP